MASCQYGKKKSLFGSYPINNQITNHWDDVHKWAVFIEKHDTIFLCIGLLGWGILFFSIYKYHWIKELPVILFHQGTLARDIIWLVSMYYWLKKIVTLVKMLLADLKFFNYFLLIKFFYLRTLNRNLVFCND
jgi:hypothetical protein